MIYIILVIITVAVLYAILSAIVSRANYKSPKKPDKPKPREIPKEKRVVYPEGQTAEERERICNNILKIAQDRHKDEEAELSVAYTRDNCGLVSIYVRKPYADLFTKKTMTGEEKYTKRSDGTYRIASAAPYGEECIDIINKDKDINERIIDSIKKIEAFASKIESSKDMAVRSEEQTWLTNEEYYNTISPQFEEIEPNERIKNIRQELQGNASFRGFTKERFMWLTDEVKKVIGCIKYIRLAFANSLLDDENFTVRHGAFLETFDIDLDRNKNNDHYTQRLLAIAADLADLVEYEENTWQTTVTNFSIIKHGIEGERLVEDRLGELTQYSIISNANLPIINAKNESEESRKTFECDSIVCTDSGVFVLEIKNYTSGALVITKDGIISHLDKYGNVIEAEKADAITQCEEHVSLLCRLLNENAPLGGDFRDWNKYVKGVIVIPNEGIEIKNESEYPVLRLSLLNNYLTSYESDIEIAEIKSATEVISNNLHEDKRFPFPNFYSYLDDGKGDELQALLEEFLELIKEKSLKNEWKPRPMVEEYIRKGELLEPNKRATDTEGLFDSYRMFKGVVENTIP